MFERKNLSKKHRCGKEKERNVSMRNIVTALEVGCLCAGCIGAIYLYTRCVKKKDISKQSENNKKNVNVDLTKKDAQEVMEIVEVLSQLYKN